jgi:histidinol-phosphatase (PHP family)
LIFGNHFPEIESNHYYDHTPGDSVKAIKDYLRVSLQGIESEIFAYMAHPDVFMRGYKTFDSHCEEVAYRLCEKAKEYQLPLEYNLAGYTNGGYPHPEFWKIAKEVGCSCIIGIDAHESAAFTNTEIYERALLEIDALGLTRIDRLFFA